MKVFNVAIGNNKTAFEIAWLEIAKGLPIGRSTRIDHGHRSKKTLQINNNIDSWSCYCYACNDGRVVRKSSIRLSDRGNLSETTNVHSSSLGFPGNSQAIHSLPGYIRDRIDIFLINKGITRDMILETGVCSLSYHMERDSLIFKLPDRVMIRSLNNSVAKGNNPTTVSKWLTSNPDNSYSVLYCNGSGNNNSVVVLEDIISTLKVIFTVKRFKSCQRQQNSEHTLPATVICNYGTRVSYDLINHLSDYDCIITGFDNDKAGIKATDELIRSCTLLYRDKVIRKMDIGSYNVAGGNNNTGSDVKNMSVLDIVEELTLRGFQDG